MAEAPAPPAPPIAVIDTSVVAKWYLVDREGDVSDAMAYLALHRDGRLRLAAPELLAVELISVLKKRGVDGPGITRSLDRLFAVRVELHSLKYLAPAAADLAGSYPISAYDACFAALANELGAPLITADRKLAASGACDARLLGEYDLGAY